MNPFNTLSVLLCLFFFSSCQKVIDVNLNDAQPQYVIEAPMFEGVHDFTVRITKTTNYFDTEQPTTVDNAVVVLKDPNSNSVTLTPQGNGWYRIANFAAIPLSSYQLEVFVDGKSFTANSTMPFHTPIDSLTTRKFNGFGPPNPDKGTELLLVHLKDSVGVKNFYRVLITKNDTILNKAENYYIFDDMVRDGLQIDAPIFTSIFKKGDKVDVELLGMDAAVYDYFNTLSEVITGDANTGAAPANPNSNFSNGALGYFAAYTSSKMSITIP
ncbi:MAG: DUF4249 domain-containing protein [Bacteroidetes bacterium]|nr:DUF4249 domain-containing protein [Bacteroidota bacterium]MBP6314880.1 DUF4249 domain-containing protein [Chitinophagaceae bacterium]